MVYRLIFNSYARGIYGILYTKADVNYTLQQMNVRLFIPSSAPWNIHTRTLHWQRTAWKQIHRSKRFGTLTYHWIYTLRINIHVRASSLGALRVFVVALYRGYCAHIDGVLRHYCYWLKIKIQKNQLIGVAHAVCCIYTRAVDLCYCIEWYIWIWICLVVVCSKQYFCTNDSIEGSTCNWSRFFLKINIVV